LVDPNLAAAIAADAGVADGAKVVEIGAGLGSLTVALADAGASEVVAIEFDHALMPPLRDAVRDRPAVTVVEADATKLSWPSLLAGGGWICCGNLPYNVGTDIVLDVLSHAPMARRLVVMVQREVAERLTASPGDVGYGPTSVRVVYRARAEIVRRVPPQVFWPRPAVASAVVRIERRERPAVAVDEAALWRVVDGSFAQRRKSMRSAMRRLGVDHPDATLAAAGVAPDARPETVGLEAFAKLVEALSA
jgi:16S rRNA (adenine1518-N6/adenine1519-N6)-dimethyltransferase